MAKAGSTTISVNPELQTVEQESIAQNPSEKRKHGKADITKSQCPRSKPEHPRSSHGTREEPFFPSPAASPSSAASLSPQPAVRRKSLYDVPEFVPPARAPVLAIDSQSQQAASSVPQANLQGYVPNIEYGNYLSQAQVQQVLGPPALTNPQGYVQYIQITGGPMNMALLNRPRNVQAQQIQAPPPHTNPQRHAPFIPAPNGLHNNRFQQVVVPAPEKNYHVPVQHLRKQGLLAPNVPVDNTLNALYHFLISVECTVVLVDGSTIKTDQVYKDRYGMYAVYQFQHREKCDNEMKIVQLKLTSRTQELEDAFWGSIPYRDRYTVDRDLSHCLPIQQNFWKTVTVWSGVGSGTPCTLIPPGDDSCLYKALDLIRSRGFRDHLRRSCHLMLL
ncbi:uncharacterized protein RCO7_04225 [Rhynchosporium graminicola]|uniref:Uncharacterized protein n=1 Tax=Rhynchosporium graminicola TaxID=2792576 RepID=A0A1E1LRI3_9HELO|nr:uncharacterized protein RCO7_04225 [Rhynchosporium commune]